MQRIVKRGKGSGCRLRRLKSAVASWTYRLTEMKAEALYDAPFKRLHAGGPDALFTGQDNVIKGIFNTLKTLHSNLQAKAG